MKKNLYLLLALAAMFCLVSCTESSESLSASTAKSLVEEELQRLNKTEGVCSVATGYFECNDDHQRYIYRQLEANGLIAYKCDKIIRVERVQKTRRVTRSYWGYSYYDTESYWVNENVTTYFVTISLTEEGKKLVMEEKEIEPTNDEKDLMCDVEVDPSKFPESKVNPDEFSSPSAKVVQASEEDFVMADSISVDTVAADEIIESPQSKPQTSTKGKKSEYEQAKEKESIEIVLLKGYELNLVKARNIMKTSDYSAVAEIIVKYENVNAVGRILGEVSEGQRTLLDNVSYQYYQDKGWQVELK